MITSGKNKMPDSFGLTKSDVDNIISILMKQPEVEEAFIFGSRAKGNFKRGSDVDIALKGSALDNRITMRVGYLLNEETIMPYHFDVLNYQSVHNEELESHIARVGISFYKKKLMPE